MEPLKSSKVLWSRVRVLGRMARMAGSVSRLVTNLLRGNCPAQLQPGLLRRRW